MYDATSAKHARALSHPTRHRLLLELGEGAATVSQLTNRLLINKGNVAHHLAVLVAAGLVAKGPTRTVRGGTEQYYVRPARVIKFEGGPDNATLFAMMSNLANEIAGDKEALLNHRILRLTKPQAAALTQHLDKLVHALEPASDRDQRYGVVVSVYRHGRTR
ncbi:ArsR family transcriptional regulator [Kribbella antibiotica]|uniref:ArsR family transcriptional regulator n=1 Tax=Kribbella antibiotica TaxID=190195 RepID=A0A4R4ZH52_9ACTN|nr:ArsR family transcriptional regulator [Kribbella antibiotica]